LTAGPEGKLDSAVVTALYSEHSGELRRFLTGLLRDHQLVNDTVQATFVKLTQKGHQTKEETRKAWLFRVAYHEAMAMRRRQAVGQRAIQQLVADHDTTEPTPEEPLVRQEVTETVQQALTTLPDSQREIVRMRIYEEKTFATIAEELNIPLGTALGRMRSALAKLREKLAEHNRYES